MYYQSRRRDDGPLREALRDKARERKRWGYRRLIVLLRRDGWSDNHKRIERIYREEGLQVPKRRRRKTAYKRKEKPDLPAGVNDRWSMDFVHDVTAQGRKLRMLNIVDDYTRECLWIETDTSLNGAARCRPRRKSDGLPAGDRTRCDMGPGVYRKGGIDHR